jgi:phage shock protein A
VPWGPNTVLKMLTMPVTQDEVLHLRAENKELKAKVKKLGTNLTALNNDFEEFKAWKATMTGN